MPNTNDYEALPDLRNELDDLVARLTQTPVDMESAEQLYNKIRELIQGCQTGETMLALSLALSVVMCQAALPQEGQVPS